MAEARGGRDTQSREWWVDIKKDLEHFSQTRKLSQKFRRTIFRIRPKLRALSLEHFKPEHLSLGLYDRTANDSFNPRTKGDTFRLALVSTWLAELGKTPADWESICEMVVDSPEAIREEYDEEGLDYLTPQDVKSILCLDAIFLACFLGAFFSVDPLSRLRALVDVMGRESSSFRNIILDDIIKLENQIPLNLIWKVLLLMYKILEERRMTTQTNRGETVFEIPAQSERQTKLDGDHRIPIGAPHPAENVGDGETGERIKETVDKLPKGLRQQHDIQEEEAPQRTESELSRQADEALQQICAEVAAFHHEVSLPGFPHSANQAITYDINFKDSCKHLLHCLYASLKLGLHRDVLPTPPTACLRTAAHKVMAYCLNARPKKLRYSFARLESMQIPVPSASQLIKAGVDFRGQEGTFMDVKFHIQLSKATLFLPRIDFVGDGCEPVWRNLVAFEDEHETDHEFKSYLAFMDDLIDTERDVALLKRGRHPVIVNNGLGDNKDVARLFNSMLTNYSINRSAQWQDLRREIMVFYSSENRRAWVEFVRTKFGKPWLAVSVIAGTVLLFLTLIQTVFAILTYEATIHPAH